MTTATEILNNETLKSIQREVQAQHQLCNDLHAEMVAARERGDWDTVSSKMNQLLATREQLSTTNRSFALVLRHVVELAAAEEQGVSR